ncbi:MAG: alanine racemase [Oscillospiraceae bacterium]|nr:alanine racemase [Oscillospiraceae bacterium]
MKAYVVDQKGLSENIRIIREKAGNVPVYGIIKGNGYGLGLLPLAEALRDGGIDRYGVTEASDVRALREGGFQKEEILMLRATSLPEELSELLELGAVGTVASLDNAMAMEAAAAAAGKEFPCHIKIDTGMGRYGFFPGDTDTIAQVFQLPHLNVTGIYTHFHSAFCNEKETRSQYAAFKSCCDALAELGLDVGIRHCCNSSAFFKYPEMYMDAVRVGSALLGRLSFPGDFGLQRLGWCQAQVEILRDIPAGHTVGYGSAWRAKRPTRIAVCSVGYYNGFGAEKGADIFRFRDCVRGGLSYVKAFLKRKAYYVSVNGKRARVLGHIGMVQTICDVTDIPCEIGDPIRIEINPLLQKGLEIVYQHEET